jgi:two-component sensor histidine kinase
MERTRPTATVAGLFLLFLAMCPACLYGLDGDEEFVRRRPRVLVLHSYHEGFTWTDNVTAGIDSVFEPVADRVEICYEYMDVKRLDSSEYFDTYLRFLTHKYKDRRLDAIISSDDQALTFLTGTGASFHPDVPLVFCAVNGFDPEVLEKRRPVTGIVETIDIEATVDIATKLFPKTRRVVSVTDRTLTGRSLREQAERAYREFPELESVFLENLSIEQIADAAGSYSDDTVLMAYIFSRDLQGRVFSHEVNLARLSQKVELPIFSVWEFYLGDGIVGGMLTRGREHGRFAAETAARILCGTPADEIPVSFEELNTYMFDYDYLSQHGIGEDPLPEGSVVVNRKPTLYEMYTVEFWVTAGVIAVLVVATIVLALSVRHRREAERALREALESKELLLREIHHRVKNNMAIIASFVSFGRYRMEDDPETSPSAVLDTILERVSLLSELHSFLYVRGRTSQYVEATEFFTALLPLFDAVVEDNERIQITHDIESLRIRTDDAIALGLIVNESVTNAIKHAFPESQSGTVHITFRREGDGARLEIRDNGRGLPRDGSSTAYQSVGLSLIDSLSGQLGGECDVVSNGGTTVRVELPADKIT